MRVWEAGVSQFISSIKSKLLNSLRLSWKTKLFILAVPDLLFWVAMEVEQLPAENHLKWVVGKEEEEYEEAALQGRQSSQHREDDVITGVVLSSSSSSWSSPTSIEVGDHSNGTNPDGPPVQKEEKVAEMGNVIVNGYHSDGEQVGGAALGLAVVAELLGSAANEEAVTSTTVTAASQNQNSVYFDKQEGIWKCHHCTWTKRFDGPWTVPIWNLEGHSDLPINLKTMIAHGPCFICETEGSEVNNGHSGAQNGDGARSVAPENHEEGEFNIQADSDQYVKTVDDKCPSSSEISHLQNSSEVKAKSIKDFSDEISTKAGPDLIEDIDQGLKEIDVEAVLAKQETHDLFCPNCHSCITKRVILRKRKRHVSNLDPKAKRDKCDPLVNSTIVDSPEYKSSQGDHVITTSDVGSQEPPTDHHNSEREPEVFRCLSCFSFFIPSGNGFNIFRNFGGVLKQNTPQNSSVMPASILQSPPTMPAANLQSPLNMPAANLQSPANRPAANLQSPFNMPAANFQSPSNMPAVNSESSSNMPTSNANWFLSLFTSNKGKISSKQGEGDASLEHSKTDTAEQNHSSSITSNMLTSSETGRHRGLDADTTFIKNGKPMIGIKPEHEGLNSLIPSTVDSVKTEILIKKDFKSNMAPGKESLADQQYLDLFQNDSSSMQSYRQTVSNLTNGLQKMGNNLLDFSGNERMVTGNVRTNVGEEKNVSADIIKTDIVAISSSMNFSGDKLPLYEIDRLVTSVTGETLVNVGEAAKDAILTNNAVVGLQTSEFNAKIPLIEKANGDILEEKDPAVSKGKQGGDVTVLIEAQAVKSTTSQSADTVAVEGGVVIETPTQVFTDEHQRADIAVSQEWEILKSIVYGGLIESITSLGVVSSAVGAGAGPLNVIALGLANLISGLFIIGHNLIELKNDLSGGDLQQMNTQQDRYQELLGRRANFILHAVVAILSFLIFGSVPIAVYGFLIRKNYYTEVKLAAVAAASLLCIILLAIGRAYTKRPPNSYIKTVLQYFTIALAASGASYIVGGLIKDLLEKYINSESGSVLNMPVSSRGSMEPTWMSY